MKLTAQRKTLQRHVLVVSMAVALPPTVASPLRATTPEPAMAPVAAVPTMEPARQCLTDLSALKGQMQNDDDWCGVTGHGYGYEVRTLLVATQIPGQLGQQAPCEALLSETRDIYGHYAAETLSGHAPRDDVSGWCQAQLATAEPVASKDVSYRPDKLIGTKVLNPKGDTLSSVDAFWSTHLSK